MQIREATGGDAPVIAGLLGELGYPTEAAELPQRLEGLAAEVGAGVIVAVPGDDAGTATATAADEPLGVLAFAEFQPLERPAPTCRILTLVVDSRHRREASPRRSWEPSRRAPASGAAIGSRSRPSPSARPPWRSTWPPATPRNLGACCGCSPAEKTLHASGVTLVTE